MCTNELCKREGEEGKKVPQIVSPKKKVPMHDIVPLIKCPKLYWAMAA